jgi:hypothetical protein
MWQERKRAVYLELVNVVVRHRTLMEGYCTRDPECYPRVGSPQDSVWVRGDYAEGHLSSITRKICVAPSKWKATHIDTPFAV